MLQIGRGGSARQGADPLHQGGAFGGGDYAAGVHQVEEVRALQAVVVGGEDREALQGSGGGTHGFAAVLPGVEEFLGFLLVELKLGA